MLRLKKIFLLFSFLFIIGCTSYKSLSLTERIVYFNNGHDFRYGNLTNNNYLLSSKGEARRLIRGSGVKINNTTVSDENMKINNSLFINESRIKLSVGKKKHIILEKK